MSALFRTARCVKILGKGVVKVVHKCDDAKENQKLGMYKLFLLNSKSRPFYDGEKPGCILSVWPAHCLLACVEESRAQSTKVRGQVRNNVKTRNSHGWGRTIANSLHTGGNFHENRMLLPSPGRAEPSKYFSKFSWREMWRRFRIIWVEKVLSRFEQVVTTLNFLDN